MTKEEFLNELQDALSGEVSYQTINDNISYYRKYIEDGVQSGRSEAEVLEELGDPRLIAKTITEVQEVEEGHGPVVESQYVEEDGTPEMQHKSFSADTSTFTGKLKVYMILALILVAVFVVLAVITRVFIWLLPAIIVCVAISAIIKFFRRL